MAFEITIPRLGWSMEEGTFVRWLKQDGDTVHPGDPLFELEGEKAAQDIEAVDGGILSIPASAPKPGTVVSVGATIGFLLAAGEVAPTNQMPAQGQRREVTPAAEVTAQSPPAAPSVRRMARELGVNLADFAGSGPAGRITAQDLLQKPSVSPVASIGTSTIASPRARRIAGELGINWKSIQGTGRDGRVRERDIRNAASGNGSGNAASSQQSPNASIPITKHRRTTAERMRYSRQNTAPVTLTTKIDATNLVSLRQQFKSAGAGVVPSYNDIVIKLCSLVLPDHPLLMARWHGDQLSIPSQINIGLAVDSDAGLLVPVVRDVRSLTLPETARESLRLINLAREGKLKAADMQDGVFTVTNLGSYGIDTFTPIINSPESAILGIGRIRRDATVVENQIVARDQMSLSLTFDHCIVDGAPAARFLQVLSQAIESPSAWLLRAET